MSFFVQDKPYVKILSKNDNKIDVRCQVRNPLFDEINAEVNDSNGGNSASRYFEVTCK